MLLTFKTTTLLEFIFDLMFTITHCLWS